MKRTKHTSIEFSEAKQCFHLNNGEHEEMTNGFQTLLVATDIMEANLICNYLEEIHNIKRSGELKETMGRRKISFKNLKKSTDKLIEFLCAYNKNQYALQIEDLENKK